MSEDVFHLVLARTGPKEAGSRAFSLFLTARSMAGPAIRITRIEEKLGLHASPTCQMMFDSCPAELVGAEGDGLKAMFVVMNHARLDVSLQGVAHAARAYAIAAAHAAERKQGRRADGSEAVLEDHADVRRMLDEQRRLALGARAMVHIAIVEGQRDGELLDFLTPLCKVFCTEAGIKAADLGIQILGGYGYLTEYRISQTWRDARITSIYEGANAIHEVATATRGLRGSGADTFDEMIGRLTDNHQVHTLRNDWRSAREVVAGSDDPKALAHEFTSLTCRLFYQAALARIAKVAKDAETRRVCHQGNEVRSLFRPAA